VEKRMSVAEICYNMHASSFLLYGQLFDLIGKGFVRVAGELPEPAHVPAVLYDDEVLESISDLIESAEKKIEKDPEGAMVILQRVLQEQPDELEAQELLETAEEKYIALVYKNHVSPEAIPTM